MYINKLSVCAVLQLLVVSLQVKVKDKKAPANRHLSYDVVFIQWITLYHKN